MLLYVSIDCPTGYELHSEKCYKYFSMKKNFNDSRDICKIATPEGDLAILLTPIEIQIADSYLTRKLAKGLVNVVLRRLRYGLWISYPL